jgi:hypothetical protein
MLNAGSMTHARTFLLLSFAACCALAGHLWLFDALHDLLEVAARVVRQARLFAFAFLGLAVAAQAVWLVWVYRSWRWVHLRLHPEDAPSPARVTAFLLIPLVNFFWCFIATAKLCALMNDELERLGEKRRAPTGRAIVACLVGTWQWALLPRPLPWLALLVPLAWGYVMRGVELARTVIEENRAAASSARVP